MAPPLKEDPVQPVSRRLTPAFFMALAACFGIVSLTGCGGGGSTPRNYLGRSFVFTSGSRTVGIAIDPAGRLTIVATDPASLPAPVGAQGVVAAGDAFFAQTADGQVQFDGQVAASGETISCTVKRAGSTLFDVVLPVVAQGAGPYSAIRGTFAASGPTDQGLLTVDGSGHAVLWVSSGGTTGSALVTVGSDGALASGDGTTVGQLTAGSSSVTLSLTRLNGTPVSISLDLAGSTRAKWTFMVYINAANDLQTFGPLNVNQMEKLGSTADVNIVVQWKQADCASCGNPAWVSTRRYFVTRDANTNVIGSQLVEDMGPNVDMGDWRELNAFIRWSQQRYPADRYALVVWDHGAGWRSTRAGQPARLRSVSIDDSTGNEIQTWELPQALNVSPKIDLLIFDASLMQMTEVAYEVRDMATLMVGSEESPPGEGYVYDAFLQDLVATPSMTPRQFAERIVTRTLESYGTNSNITQSAVDLSQMQTLAELINAFAGKLSFHSAANSAALIGARKNAESYLYRDNKDLWHYAELVRVNATTPALQTAAANVQQALKDAIVAEASGTLHPNSHGLAIYVPDPSAYLISYSNLAFSRVTDWDTWLQNQPPG